MIAMGRTVAGGFICGLMITTAIVGCPTPQHPNAVRLQDGCPMACEKLRRFHCSEGQSPKCVDLCREIIESGYLDVDLDCINASQDADDLRKCGVCNP